MFSRYAKVLLLTPTTGSLAVCSLGLVAGGVYLSRLSGSDPIRQAVVQPIATAKPFAEQTPLVKHTGSPASRPPLPVTYVPSHTKKVPHHANQPSFVTGMTDDHRAMLQQDAGMPVKDVIRSERFRAFIDTVVPYAPFHYGVDVPLTQALESILAASSESVEVRDGRYMILSTSSAHGISRGLLWIDLQDGVCIGGIYFHPQNGEPTPTLTLFSRQVTNASIRLSQFPPRFSEDLRQWSTAAGLPTVTTRYFVNAANRKSVLLHEETTCKQPLHVIAIEQSECVRMHAEAVNLDARAAVFLEQAHYASNATLRMSAGLRVPSTTSLPE